MASVISGASNTPHGYSIEPADKPKPRQIPARYDFDKDERIEFSCQHGTLYLKISSVLLVVSFVIQAIAVGAPYWSAGWRRDKMSWFEGVWMTCVRTEDENIWICGSWDYQNPKPGLPSWYTFCQAMGLCSLVIFLPTLMINFFYTMHPKEKMFKGLRFFNFFFTASTSLIPFLMVMVWGIGHPKDDRFPVPYADQDYDDNPFEFHFSFFFEILAVLLSAGAFVLEIIDLKQNA